MNIFQKAFEKVKNTVANIISPPTIGKLDNYIDKFNKKVSKVREEHPETAELQPDIIGRREKQALQEKYENAPKSDLRSEIDSLARYLDKGAENIIEAKSGNKVTEWKKNEVQAKVDIINEKRAKELEKVENMDATSRGQKIGLKRGEMGSERLNGLKPKNFEFDNIRPGVEWDKFVETVEKQASPEKRAEVMEQYKTNYIEALWKTFGDYGSEIVDIIKNLPAERVVETYYIEQEASIDFVYSPEEMFNKLDILQNIWNGAYEIYENEVYS